MKTKTTQKAAVLKLLKQGKKLNWLNTFKLTGCSSIARRIPEFIEQGYVIDKKIVKFKTRYGTHGAYKVYSINFKKTPKHLLK
jgi:hypothetical protein